MKTVSPYCHPWTWLMREIAIMAAFALTALTVFVCVPPSLPQFLLFGTLVALAVVVGARIAVDILVAALCQWFEAMGAGMGSLVTAFRGRRSTK